MEFRKTDVEEAVCKRMEARLKDLSEVIAYLTSGAPVFVAGNSCNIDIPKDYDIYPQGISGETGHFDLTEMQLKAAQAGYDVVCVTKNALTVKTDGELLQFCTYSVPTLKLLVESFDFAHVKLGVSLIFSESDMLIIDECYISEDWYRAKCLGYSYYALTDDALLKKEQLYPFASLIRAFKYHARGDLSFGWKGEVARIVRMFLLRGFSGYDDFKDQMAAVDLCVFNEDAASLYELYKACETVGLVKESRGGTHSLNTFISEGLLDGFKAD